MQWWGFPDIVLGFVFLYNIWDTQSLSLLPPRDTAIHISKTQSYFVEWINEKVLDPAPSLILSLSCRYQIIWRYTVTQSELTSENLWNLIR